MIVLENGLMPDPQLHIPQDHSYNPLLLFSSRLLDDFSEHLLLFVCVERPRQLIQLLIESIYRQLTTVLPGPLPKHTHEDSHEVARDHVLGLLDRVLPVLESLCLGLRQEQNLRVVLGQGRLLEPVVPSLTIQLGEKQAHQAEDREVLVGLVELREEGLDEGQLLVCFGGGLQAVEELHKG